MIGRILGGYRIIEQIGMGGMATVYKAYDSQTDRFVAIKILPPQYSQDPNFRARFEQEAKAIAHLEHLHILPIFAYGEDEGTTYMVMRFMDSGTLTQLIKQQRQMPLNETSRLLTQIASALDYAHGQGIIHRDIKPSNVLIDRHGNAFLTDFGIAKIVESNLALTGTDMLLGTPQYMSPEQCRGEKNLTPASDQYSLGVMVYEMVTGRTPYQAETPAAVIRMQLMSEPLPMPRSLRPELPPEAEKILLKALANSPESRYPTCGEFAAAFEEAIKHGTLVGRGTDLRREALPDQATVIERTAPTLPEETEQPPRRRLRYGLLGGLAAALVIVAAAFALGVFSGEEAEEVAAAPTASPTASATFTAAPSSTPTPRPTETPTATASITPSPTFTASPLPTHTALPTSTPEADLIAMQLAAGGGVRVRGCDQSSAICLDLIGAGTTIRLDLPMNDPFMEGAFSPDGHEIVFEACVEGTDCNHGNRRLYRVRSDGSGLVALPRQTNADMYPSWSPNGEWIAYSPGGDLAIMHPDGTGIQILKSRSESFIAYRPRWSPDSAWVAVINNADASLNYPSEIWVIGRDGSNSQRVFVEQTGKDTLREMEWMASGDLVFLSDNLGFMRLNTACLVDRSCGEDDLTPYPPGIAEPWRPNYFPQWAGEEVERLIFAQAYLKASGVSLYEKPTSSAIQMLPPITADFVYLLGEYRDWLQVITLDGRLGWLPADALRVEPIHIIVAVKVFDKPDGNVIGETNTSETYWAIARSADGSWLEILSEDKRGWVRREVLPNMDVDFLPVWVEEVTAPPLPAIQRGNGGSLRVTSCDEPPELALCFEKSDGQRLERFPLPIQAARLNDAEFSPDGSQIVFSACAQEDCSDGSQLYLINSDGTGLIDLPPQGNELMASWSPDGEWIAYHSRCELRRIRPTGADMQTLVDQRGGTFCATNPVWSPDGEWLAVINNPPPGNSYPADIWVMTRHGEHVQQVFAYGESGRSIHLLAWTPEGDLVFEGDDIGRLRLAAGCLRDQSCGEADLKPYPDPVPDTWLPNTFPQWSGAELPRPLLAEAQLQESGMALFGEPSGAAPPIPPPILGVRVYLSAALGDWLYVITLDGRLGWLPAEHLRAQQFTPSGAVSVLPAPFSRGGAAIGELLPDEPYWAAGRSANKEWVEILYLGRRGWIRAESAQGVDLDALPVIES